LEGRDINLISDGGSAAGADVITEHDRLGGFGRFVVGKLTKVGGVFKFTGTSVNVISSHVETKTIGGGGSPRTTGGFVAGGVVAGGVRDIGGGYLVTKRMGFISQDLIPPGADTGDGECVLVRGQGLNSKRAEIDT